MNDSRRVAEDAQDSGSSYVDENATSGNESYDARPTTEQSSSESASKHKGEVVDEPAQRPAKSRKNAAPKRYLRSEYRDLLNATILEINGSLPKEDCEQLPPSQISGSYWTTSEKESFFSQLSLTGPGDLPALSCAVGSKSEPEIKAYLSLLELGVREADAEARLEDRFTLVDVPAASAIGRECESVASRAAEALGHFVESEEARREEAKHGKWWLINQGVADGLNELYEEGLSAEELGKAEDGIKSEIGETAPAGVSTESPADLLPIMPVQSALLLDPAAFLQLSRSLFMNRSTDPESNWNNLVDPRGTPDGPAIYRKTFDDFHNLAVSLTRRLVQASIFQSLTRLRASHDSRTKPSINATDVETALHVLGMETDKKAYWAKAARRCGVNVYTETKKFMDGRPKRRNGVKLTLEEVEAEMGLPNRIAWSEDQVGVTEAEIRDLEMDSDAFTEIGSENHLQAETPGALDQGSPDDEMTPSEASDRGRPTKRKRALSPRSYDKAEEEYLDKLDLLASAEEENRLREVLRLDPLPPSSGEEPELAFKRAEREERPPPWRDVVENWAPWELHGRVDNEEFELMGLEGKRARDRRGLVGEAVRERMQQQSVSLAETKGEENPESASGSGSAPENESGSEFETQPKLENDGSASE